MQEYTLSSLEDEETPNRAKENDYKAWLDPNPYLYTTVLPEGLFRPTVSYLLLLLA